MVAASVQAFEEILQFFSFITELFDQFKVGRGNGLTVAGGKVGQIQLAKIFLSKVYYGYIEKPGKLEQVADLGFSGAIFIRGNVSAIQAHMTGKLSLAHTFLLP